MPAPVNYTTQIAATKTVGEMQTMLADHGAQRIAVDYENGCPSALTFALLTEHGMRLFTLPANIDAMERLLVDKERRRELKSGSKATRSSRAQAERVAWRIMKDWLGAQLAMIESTMVTIDQVMLPYLRVNDSHTLWDVYREGELKALTSGSSS